MAVQLKRVRSNVIGKPLMQVSTPVFVFGSKLAGPAAKVPL
jgi:hypothetical protein